MEKTFRAIINEATTKFIPAGRRNLYKPGLNNQVTKLLSEHNRLRETNPTSNQIGELNSAIMRKIDESKRKDWHKFVGSFNHRYKPQQLWGVIKSLSGRAQPSNNNAIIFNGKPITDPDVIADGLDKLLTRTKTHESCKEARHIVKSIKKLPLGNTQTLSVESVKMAIKKTSNSKACGPDKISPIHLKHLETNALTFLTKIYNASLKSCHIPALWKTSMVISLTKSGKDSKLSGSCRPVSLLCPAVKTLESLLLLSITEHLPPETHQHGFRPGHSTVSALLHLSSSIADDFNQKPLANRTVAVALDLTKAFDTADHTVLIERIRSSNMPRYFTRWLPCYLGDRQARTIFRGHTSTTRMIHTDVPQESVISPALFNAYIKDLPHHLRMSN